MRGVRLDFDVTLAGPHYPNTTASEVPDELKIAVGNAMATQLRSVVDRYLSAAFVGQTAWAERAPLSPEVPVLFIRIQRVRLFRDASARQGRVVKVGLTSHSGDPMADLGVPLILYTYGQRTRQLWSCIVSINIRYYEMATGLRASRRRVHTRPVRFQGRFAGLPSVRRSRHTSWAT